jgi:2'-5' RNA ligase
MLPGDRLVCAFVHEQQPGTTFKKWLLHVTIVPWFRLDDDTAQVATGLKNALSGIEPFESAVDGTVLFGPRKNRPAHLLEPAGFPEVEKRVRNYLHKKRAWLVDETTKRRHEFRPHVTMQGEDHVQQGDVLKFDRLYIVEQRGDYKEVTAEIPLGKATAR